jgi:hypothetical protein
MSQNDAEVLGMYLSTNGKHQYVGFSPYFNSLSGDKPMGEARFGSIFKLYGNKTERAGLFIGGSVCLRVYPYKSSPVFPPSYMPFINYVHFIKKSNYFLSFTLGHESNGSDESFYLIDSTNINIRYGDFSTNNIQISFGIIKNNLNQAKLHRFDIGYRIEGGIKDTRFVYDSVFKHSYGEHKIVCNYEFVSNKISLKPNSLNEFQYRLRIEQKYILSSLANYQNMFNNNKYRYSVLLRLTVKHTLLNEFEPFLQVYHGRDYYNIRYVERLNSIMLGISVNI